MTISEKAILRTHTWRRAGRTKHGSDDDGRQIYLPLWRCKVCGAVAVYDGPRKSKSPNWLWFEGNLAGSPRAPDYELQRCRNVLARAVMES